MNVRPTLLQSVLTASRAAVDFEKTLLDASMVVAASFARGELADVGCGDKPYESVFLPRVTKYVGVEYDDTYGTSAYAKRTPRADLVYRGDQLPLADASFDTVLCNQVGEHVSDPRVFFRELARILRPGGHLIFTVPFSYRVHSDPHDFHRFTKYALQSYSDESGLDVIEISPRGGFWSVIGQKLTSHLALRVARMQGDIQSIGGFGYERAIVRRTRYWTLPVVAPAILGVALAAKALDRLDYDDSDTIGYMLIAKKPAVALG